MQCGKPLEPDARYCGNCGTEVHWSGQAPTAATGHNEKLSQIAAPDTPAAAPVLLRFGPMGVAITSKRPALFTTAYRNTTEIVADAAQLWGIGKLPKFAFPRLGKGDGRIVFQIPYDGLVSVTRADYLGNKALWILYRQNGEETGVGIQASVLCQSQLLNLEKLLQEKMPVHTARQGHFR